MDTTRGILLLVVTLIIIVSIYYIVKMVKGKRTPTQPSTSTSPSDQTDEISISDLKFERTLNPDKSNSKGGDIVGYTIEYDGINYATLSENVTFTLGWKNNIGFTGKVTGFRIEHYVSGDNETFDKFTKQVNPEPANQSMDFTTKKNSDTETKNAVSVDNFEKNSVSFNPFYDTTTTNDNGETTTTKTNYSVVGKNRFRISAIMNDGTPKILYNGLDSTYINNTNHEIEISEKDLGATLDMTVPQTVTYTPALQKGTFNTTLVDIIKIKYKISNDSGVILGYSGSGSIYLMPASGGTTDENTNEKIDVDTFFFKYELGENKYLLYDGTNGTWNENENRFDDDTQELNAGNVDQYDNRMYVSFYNKEGSKTQLRAPVTGRGTGGKFLTSDESNAIVLKDLSSEGTISQKEFTNSYWTFEEVQGDPENCKGEWVVTDDGTVSGTKIEEFDLLSEAKNNGTCEASEGETRETLVDVDCKGEWVVTDDGTVSGTKIEKFNLITSAKNNGTCEASEGDIRTTDVDVNCKGEWGVCKPNGGICGWNGLKTYEVSIKKQHGGSACEESHGQTKVCYLGQCGH